MGDGDDVTTLGTVGLAAEVDALRALVAELRAENARLLRLVGMTKRDVRAPDPTQTGLFEQAPGQVDARSPAAAKVEFFAALFRARRDVYAVRRENARTGRSGWMPWSRAPGEKV